MDNYFEDQVKKIPYQELLNDPDFKKQLQKEYMDVTTVDLKASQQKYVMDHLTPDELKILNEGDGIPKSGYYFQTEIEQKRDALAKKFMELERIPEKYMIPDIGKTPTFQALSGINALLIGYTDLALKDIDTSVKAGEYFIKLKNKLETFSPSVQIKLIDEIMLPEMNIAVWTHKKFHPDENVFEYQKRWEKLRNSLNAKFIEYRNQLVLAEK